ncbi:MAG TPA: ABC transporter ATP-binding protein [Candidatus Mediterraneibacter norfolkensis]|nr:ABC transporter ATP-binding protein [Candidatus Mediterraneibacter norfolkensis]
MLKIENLKKEYGDFILDCTMRVEPGSITGLVGENGAGKSTTFKAVLGLIRSDGGEIALFGRTPEQFTKEDRRKMGVVLADSGFSGYLNVREVLPVLNAMYPKFDRKRFGELCGRFDIPMDKKIREFSTGMKAKLKVITAVTHGAEILILDEPTSGLDVMARRDVLDILREYMEEDDTRSILISSHISTDLENLCDDIYMIHDGKIILHEDTDVLLEEYGLIKADEDQFAGLDKSYILKVRRESYGYACLTDQKQYYRENYPDMVVENSMLDEVIAMMIGGEKL